MKLEFSSHETMIHIFNKFIEQFPLTIISIQMRNQPHFLMLQKNQDQNQRLLFQHPSLWQSLEEEQF